jgi:hypothetical protein
MKKWPLPNLDGGKIRIDRDWSQQNWNFGGENKIFKNRHPFDINLPRGWGNEWPALPKPDDDDPSEIRLNTINLRSTRNRCSNNTLLGYYMSWHIVGVSFYNENGRLPINGDELKGYNDSLPKENRFGIHICCRTIENYINQFSTDGLESSQIPLYLEYCTYLTMLYVIAHEWGHYRSEVLSFQIKNLIKSISGESNSSLSPSYLSYFVYKKEYPDTNFEEVFSEWASLKLGVFNYYMKKPGFAYRIANWPLIEATVKYMLTEAISSPTRIRPYSDVRFWIDFDNISRNEVMKRVSENKPSINRSVNDNVLIDGIKSLKNGKIIDLLMHNQIQFSNDHNFNGIIKSAPRAYPMEPDSSFYHFGNDECFSAKNPSSSENFLQLGKPEYSDPIEQINSRIIKAVDIFKDDKTEETILPIKVFSELLPLDPVYFHT